MLQAADEHELQEEEEGHGSFSRRKLVSNWDRYEDAEKEAQQDAGESQRGTDFSILLSSAGKPGKPRTTIKFTSCIFLPP